MCETIGGKAGQLRSGAAIAAPPFTDAISSSIERSITALPAVLPVISIAWMIGTPAAVRDDSVRDHRAIATFCTTSPIFIGIRSLKASQRGLPQFDRLQYKKPNTIATNTTRNTYHCFVSP